MKCRRKIREKTPFYDMVKSDAGVILDAHREAR